MGTFIFTIIRLFQALFRGFKDRELQGLAFLTFVTLASGTFFYCTVEDWRILDALYFCVITLTTVGYGDISPQTDAGKLFTIVYVFAGLGLIVGFVTRIADYMGIRLRRGNQKNGEGDRVESS